MLERTPVCDKENISCPLQECSFHDMIDRSLTESASYA